MTNCPSDCPQCEFAQMTCEAIESTKSRRSAEFHAGFRAGMENITHGVATYPKTEFEFGSVQYDAFSLGVELSLTYAEQVAEVLLRGLVQDIS